MQLVDNDKLEQRQQKKNEADELPAHERTIVIISKYAELIKLNSLMFISY